MIVTSERKLYIWKVIDISIEKENYLKVIEKTEDMIDELKNININIIVIVTDSTGSYAAARQRLRQNYRDIIFLPCYAQQLNLCIDEVFKESTNLKCTIDKAIQLAVYFKNANNKYFIEQLYNQQKIIYE
ncbi:10411_t:CDS:2, partial [Scutellospora calospora]